MSHLRNVWAAMETRPPSRSRIGEPEPSDAVVGDWSQQALVAMDEKFTTRLSRAIEAGEEHMPARRERKEFPR